MIKILIFWTIQYQELLFLGYVVNVILTEMLNSPGPFFKLNQKKAFSF